MGERDEGQFAGGFAALTILWALSLATGLLLLPPTAQAADSRCPIVALPSASGASPIISTRRDLPDTQPAEGSATAGSYGRASLADDFEESKPAPFWDRTSWMESHSFALTSASVKNGLRAMLLTVHHGDKEEFVEDKASGDRRCVEHAELGEADSYWPTLGDDLWYGFGLYLPANFPALDRRLVLAQIKQVTAKKMGEIFSPASNIPALALRLKTISAGNVLCLYTTGGNDDMNDLRPISIVQLARPQALGVWHNIVLHARLSHGKSTGAGVGSAADWWFDDQAVPPTSNRPIAIGYKTGGDLSYFKLGPYRDQAIKGSSEIDQDWTIGYDAVKREIGYPGRPGDPLSEQSVAPAPIDPVVGLNDTTACRKALGLKS